MVLQVMFLWFLAFWMLGYCAVPNSLDLLGLDGADLSARGQVRLCISLTNGDWPLPLHDMQAGTPCVQQVRLPPKEKLHELCAQLHPHWAEQDISF